MVETPTSSAKKGASMLKVHHLRPAPGAKTAKIPVAGVDYKAVQACLPDASSSGVLGLVNLFSGGALLQLSIFALGIMPYITASIIVQLLTVVIPKFETLKKEGQAGTAKLTPVSYT